MTGDSIEKIMNTFEKKISFPESTPWYGRKWLCNVVFFLAVIIWFGIFAWYDVDLHHDGIMLAAADQVAKKRVIFRDVFCQYGALTVWIQSLPVSFFGADVLVIRLTTVLFYGFIALLGANIWGRFLKFPFKWIWHLCFFALCPFYLMSFHPWTSVYALFFMLLGLEMQLRFLEDDTSVQHPAEWAGVCAFGAFLCRTPCGIVTLAAGILLFLLHAQVEKTPRRFRGLLSYVGGAGAAALLYAAYLTVAGAWEDYILQCFKFASTYATGTSCTAYWQKFCNTLFPAQDPLGVCSVIFLLFPLLTIGAIWGMCRKILSFSREDRKKQLPLAAVLLLTAASLHQYYPVPCFRHLWWAAIPAFGVYALTAQKIWERQKSMKIRVVLLIVLATPLLTAFAFRGATVVDTAAKLPRMITADLPGMRNSLMLKDDYAFIKSLYNAFNDLPAEIRQRGVLNHTPDGGFNLLFPALPEFNYPMFVNWYDLVYPDYTAVISFYVEQKKPVILSTMLEKIPEYRIVFKGRRFDKNFYLFAPLD